MKRLLIAMMVVAGMSLATSSVMAQGRYHGHPHRGYYRAPVPVHVSRHYYHPAPIRHYGPRYYAPVHPRYYAPPVYYQPAPAIGIHTRGFSFGIGF